MPRCITCDSCSEIDGTPPQSYWWSDRDSGYLCTPCRKEGYIFTPTHDKFVQLPGEEETLDTDINPDLEGLELLAKPHVVRYSEDPED